MKNYVLVLMSIFVLFVLFILDTSVVAKGFGFEKNGFGFEKNIEHRKNADVESVSGCRTSCQEMLAGWLEMNPDSKNYDRQEKKITAKAEQCLAMNELAGFPILNNEILFSCGQESSCVKPNDCVFQSDLSGEEILALPACTNVPPCDANPFDPNIFGIDIQGNLCDPKKQCNGSTPECHELPPGTPIDQGACTNISAINELGIPQCCTTDKPRDIDCGDQEWVVGVAAFPVCYISGS